MSKAILYLVLMLAVISARQWYHDVKATSLNQELFDTMVGGENHVLIEYFTPWCGYCQQMAGEWNKLFTHYEESIETRKDVKITKINCDENQRLCHSQEVRQFPTILLYPAGHKTPTKSYQGWRRFDDFKEFIESNVPASNHQVNQIEGQPSSQAQQQLEQQQREEEQKRKQLEEEIRLREEAIERQHREEILRLKREEEQRLKKEAEEKQRIEQEEEQRRRELQEEERKKEALASANNNNTNNIQSQQNVGNEGVLIGLVNQVIQQTRSIQHQVQQIPEIQSNLHQLSVNLDYTAKKVNIVEDHLKQSKDTIQTLLTEIHKLQIEVRSLATLKEANEAPQQQKQQQQQQQQQQQVKTDSQNVQTNNTNNGPTNKGFNILNSVILLAVGICLGYIFFRFLSGKNQQSLLISHNEIGKSN